MYQKVKAYVERHHMLAKKDKVIVGVSGGADSVCLLFVLGELKKELDITITAVHIHHGLRGAAADADENYVRTICREQQIKLKVFHKDVKAYADKMGMGEEEAGRNIRREIFYQVLEEENADHIALAHHKNDNVETFLWNLSRGAGVSGAAGIRPVNGVWIRPLLCVERAEIEAYLRNRRISYCTDETNFEDYYMRNRLRNQVIPYFEENINEKTIEHMAEAIEHFRQLDEYIQSEVKKYQEVCVKKYSVNWVLIKEKFEQIPEIFKTYVIHHLLGEFAGQKKDIETTHVKNVCELMKKQVGKSLNLPYEITALRCYEGIEFAKKAVKEPEEKLSVEMRVFSREGDRITFPENPYTKWFDYDIIKCTVKLRHRESGDYITIHRDGSKKKLKQYFVDEKIPQKQRDHIWLIADGQHIMWVIGHRQNQAYQITENTKNILEIRVNGGEKWQKQ